MQKDLKKALKDGEIQIGCFFRLPSPDLVEIFGLAGFDFIIIDQEHGPLSPQTTSDLVRSCDLSGLAAIVRLPDNLPWIFQHALDVGARGVQVPQVQNAADARRAVESAKFAPEGKRGVCRNVRAARFSALDRFAYLQASNQESVVVIQIESLSGVESIQEILQVPGVDVIFLGPYDLSQSMGILGQVDHPRLRSVMEGVVNACRTAGVAAGVYADTPEAVSHWAGLGVQYIAVGIDTALIYSLARGQVEKLRQVAQESRS